jgi:hypothetical protein
MSEDANLDGGALSSLALVNLEMGVEARIVRASKVKVWPLYCGREEDLSETSMPRSPSAT